MSLTSLEADMIGASKKPDSLDASTSSESVTSDDNTPNEKIIRLKNLVEQGKQAEEELRQLEAARLEEVFRQSRALEEEILPENLRQRLAREKEIFRQSRALEEEILAEKRRKRLVLEEDIQRQLEEYDNMTPEERRKHDEEEQLQLEEEAKWHEQYDKEEAAHERRRLCYPHLNLRPFDDPYDSEDEFDNDTAKRPMSPMKEAFYNLIGDALYERECELERERCGYKFR